MKTSIALSVCLCSLILAGCDHDAFMADQEAMDFRIVGGSATTTDPAIPLVLMFDAQQQMIGNCTGSLIDPSWVLLAAHCIAVPEQNVAAIGAYFGADATVEDDPNFLHSESAVEAWVHEAYVVGGEPAQGNDIALIKLANPAPIQPVAVNTTPIDGTMIGAPVRLVGWGVTAPNAQDAGIKRAVNAQLFEYGDDRINVGDAQGNTCRGDSGGPAFMNIGGQEVVVGVTSYGDADCLIKGISMRTDAFVPWIEATMGKSLPGGGGGGGDGGGGGGGGLPGGGGQTGSTCNAGQDCASGICATPGAGQGFCTQQCATDSDCPVDYACASTNDPTLNVCVPDPSGGDEGGGLPGNDTVGLPGGLGDDGDDDDDDDSDRDSDRDAAQADGDDDGCNCRADRGAPPPAGLAILLLGLAARRRRRR